LSCAFLPLKGVEMPDLNFSGSLPYEGEEADDDQKRRIGQRIAQASADIVEEELGVNVNRDGLVVTVP
jgi:hypothetical protein